MSSSRRRGRSSGAPATPQPPTLSAPQSEVAEALLAEAQADQGRADKGQTDQGQEPEQTPEANAMDVPAVETAAAQPAAEADPEILELSAEAQADRPVEHPAQDAAEVLASAPEPIAPDTVEAVETAVDAPSETLAPTLVEAPLAETKPALGAQPKPHSVHIGASFAFAPALAPLTEINTKLFAFARGEGEAAIAHFQALARAKSPAEAIRLQVTEMQRAADASLTCFSEIVRSANRLSDSVRRH
ncbi:Phasin [Methylobacterium sp. DB1607]|nr:Phasin [Methylobacterium sp. DB1607]